MIILLLLWNNYRIYRFYTTLVNSSRYSSRSDHAPCGPILSCPVLSACSGVDCGACSLVLALVAIIFLQERLEFKKFAWPGNSLYKVGADNVI